MNMIEQVYWQTTTEMPGGENLADLPDRVDVAVIGGGIPGLAAARQLGRRGVRVALLEAETPGWGAAFFPETNTSIRESAKILRREMIHVYPQLKGIEIEYAWGGTLDFAFDMMPHAGQLDGITYALGFAGHGVALGTHLGARLADALLDGTVRELPYAAYDFPSAPLGLYNGKPWFLPLVGAWHKILDWIQ